MRKQCLGLGMALALAACGGDPLRDVPRLSDVPMAETAGQADVVAPQDVTGALPQVTGRAEAPRKGLLGFLKRKADAAQAEAGVATTDGGVAAEPVVMVVPQADIPAESVAEAAPEPEPETEIAAAAPARRGLFGRIAGGSGGAGGSKRSKGGAPKPGAPDYQEVSLGTSLPYGAMARVCGVSDSQLGRKTQSWPERGRGYSLFDSAPGSTGPHTFYLTGFKDGCARQFTAALVMFGSPETWEQIHYGPAGASLPKSLTDRAYEGVKSSFCRVANGKPCGNKMQALEKDTVFVSVYERFEDNTRWKNILLHDGEVVALDVKG